MGGRASTHASLACQEASDLLPSASCIQLPLSAWRRCAFHTGSAGVLSHQPNEAVITLLEFSASLSECYSS